MNKFITVLSFVFAVIAFKTDGMEMNKTEQQHYLNQIWNIKDDSLYYLEADIGDEVNDDENFEYEYIEEEEHNDIKMFPSVRLSEYFYYSFKWLGKMPTISNMWTTIKLYKKKKTLLKFASSEFQQNMGWGFKIKRTNHKVVLSCPKASFNMPCSQGKITIQSGQMTASYCGDCYPHNVPSFTNYMWISFEGTGATITGDIKCFISGVTGVQAQTLVPYECPTTTTTTSTSTGPGTTSTTTTPTTTSTTTTPTTTSTTTTPTTTSTTTTPPSCSCGVENSCSRIVGGAEVCAHQYPWMVLVHCSSGTAETFHCAGSLISDQWVITSFSCLHGTVEEFMHVSVGNHDLTDNTTGYSIPVIELVEYGYDRWTHLADLALLKLESPVDIINDAEVLPLCLPDDNNTYDGEDATVAGWGTTVVDSDILPDMLHGVTTPVVNLTTCKTTFGGTKIRDQMLCHGTSGTSACVQDNGAPLWAVNSNGQGELIGTRTWATDCGETTPTVYTRISSYKNNIQQTIQGSGLCSN